MKKITILFLTVSVLCIIGSAIKAQTALNPTKDTYVLQGSTLPTGTNADTLIRVRSSNSGSLTVKRNGYVRYDISKVKGNLTKAVISVTVQLAANSVTPSGSVLDRFDIHQVDDSWDPATLIYDNQPTIGALLGSVENIARVKAADYPKPVLTVDVTGYVQNKLTVSASTISFALTDDQPSGADLRMYSTRCLKNQGQLPIQLILTGVSTGIEVNENVIPTEFSVNQNYPNPFNPETVISYNLPKSGQVEISIFNPLGQKVATLFNGNNEAGQHQISWNAKNDFGFKLNSGVYIARVQFDGQVKTVKMLLAK